MPTKEELDDLLLCGVLTQEEYDVEIANLGKESAPGSLKTTEESNTGDDVSTQEKHTGGEISVDGFALPLAMGDTFADFYLIKGILGKGGSSIIYEIENLLSEETWALKVLWPHLRSKPHIEHHFRNGHQILLGRPIPGLINIHEFIESNGILAVRMDIIQGKPLTKILEHKMSLQESLPLLKSLCTVVDSLHETHNIAHCDIKPANIMLSGSNITVIDVGIALDISSGNVDVHPALGTKETMAPEQYDGYQVGAPADRYAIGLLVYRMLAHRYPWEKGESTQQIKIRKDTDTLLPLSDAIPDITKGVPEVVHKMLHRDPALRYLRCIDFYLALEECWKIASDPTYIKEEEGIKIGGRVEVIHAFIDPLHYLRMDSIREFRLQKRNREPLLVQARNQVESLQHQLNSGIITDPSALYEIVHTHKVWNLAPLQRIPFGSKQGTLLHLRLVGDGRFEMGSLETSSASSHNEFPAFGVHLSEGFWIAETPVTQQLYEDIMGALPPILRHPEHPVHSVSWYDAIAFCNAFSLVCGFQPVYEGAEWNKNANGFRLPTEAEWEYCALAGTNNLYSGGNRSSTNAWCMHNAGGTTHPVRKLNANPWGLFDMSGNVEEWCWDYVGTYPTTTEKNLFLYNPYGPSRGEERVLRGGSYQAAEEQVRCKSRSSALPEDQWEGVGFRIAQSVR